MTVCGAVCRTLVNGRVVKEKTQLRHGARVLLGNNHLYRLSCPVAAGGVHCEGVPVLCVMCALQESWKESRWSQWTTREL